MEKWVGPVELAPFSPFILMGWVEILNPPLVGCPPQTIH